MRMLSQQGPNFVHFDALGTGGAPLRSTWHNARRILSNVSSWLRQQAAEQWCVRVSSHQHPLKTSINSSNESL